MMMQLAASVWPSDYRWKAEDMCSLVPMSRISSRQNVEVNTGSRSDTMDCGTPWRRTMSAKKACATVSTMYGCCQGDEVAVLAEAVDDGEDDRLPVHPW